MKRDDLLVATDAVAGRSGRREHDIAVVLGSGLSGFAATLPDAIEIPYGEIPGFPVPAVEGHAGSLTSAEVGGKGLLVFAGRVHTYEGWSMDDIVFGVRTAVLAGCGAIVLTNASGGVGDGLAPGDLVLISDHINLTGRNPLVGANDDRLGPRFPDMSSVYSPELRALARSAGRSVGVDVGEGVYAWFLGPSYETPAEVRMARTLGADLVGMSTVPEAIAARHMGADVVGISLVTNLAAGVAETPLSHTEVQETATQARGRFTALLDRLLAELAAR